MASHTALESIQIPLPIPSPAIWVLNFLGYLVLHAKHPGMSCTHAKYPRISCKISMVVSANTFIFLQLYLISNQSKHFVQWIALSVLWITNTLRYIDEHCGRSLKRSFLHMSHFTVQGLFWQSSSPFHRLPTNLMQVNFYSSLDFGY